ncbi:MAG TPA: Ku protein [Ignavibacteria bacterium]|nr:Ku protein [Ignavibacteria bacterium]HMQ99124.1 Ku protein [Ignavibacteria bacterium]
MKALWKGSISFGLVNIPVKLYSASQSHTLDLDMLRKGDLCQVRFARVCRDDGKEIPYEDIVKGYKYEDGDYVVLTDKDFESASVEKTHTIDILHFVNEKEIDPVYFEKPYFLEPERSGTKSYALLREAIKQTKKAGIGRFVLKNREHIGLLRLFDDIIVFNQIRYYDEIRDRDELSIPASKQVTKKEIDMAVDLIKQLSKKYNPKEYKDTYVDELKKIITKKARGQKIKPKGTTPKPSAAGSLMKLLKQSMKKKAA